MFFEPIANTRSIVGSGSFEYGFPNPTINITVNLGWKNINNYTNMHNCVRNSYKKLLFNRNIISFDKKNNEMLRWEDKLREIIEMQLYENKIDSNENDTFLFIKHLTFIDDDNKRQLHNKIRHEIYERNDMDNIISDNEEYEIESDSDIF
jgi:hypothetical protein